MLCGSFNLNPFRVLVQIVSSKAFEWSKSQFITNKMQTDVVAKNVWQETERVCSHCTL